MSGLKAYRASERPLIDFQSRFLKPIEYMFWAGILIIQPVIWYMPLSRTNRIYLAGLSIISSIFVLAMTHWVIPHFGLCGWVKQLSIFGSIALIATADYLLKPLHLHLEILFIAIIVGVGILVGRAQAWQGVILSAIALAAVRFTDEQLTSHLLFQVIIQVTALILVGILVSEITSAARLKLLDIDELYRSSNRQAQRLAVLNEVAKAIGSTIEMEDLLELIYNQLNQVIPAETYFVSLYDPQEQAQEFRILIDEGIRYPPRKVPLGHGLSSWVIESRRPLLIRNLNEERETLPVQPIRLGSKRESASWLGVPIMIGDRLLGLLVVASYMPFAFDEDDVVLLTSVASQAALALENARQHALVKEQARRDSLTGVYNHGQFLLRLNEEVERGAESNIPVSLIMLDIDHFKVYNDTYGHVRGDELLCQLVHAIKSHVKKTDIVGRWGGEEFAIGLPGATSEQARIVADRIRKTLAELDLKDKNGAPVPNPTVSQGIATFPQNARDAAELVDVADAALYVAKQSGRDQVEISKQTPL